MTIKKGLLLDHTGLGTHDLTIARALSLTTVEELLSLYTSFPKQAMNIFKEMNWHRLSRETAGNLRYGVSRAHIEGVESMRRTIGMGARPPSAERGQQKTVLQLQDVEIRPSMSSDKPRVFLSGCMGPVRNQENRQTCVAFAVAAMEECLEHKNKGDATELSEQFLYWRCKQSDGSPNEPGTWQRVAVPQVVENGICKEQIWPYNPNTIPGNEGQGPPPKGRDAVFNDAQHHKPMQGIALDPTSVDDLVKVLDNGLPAAISVPTYPNWWNRSTSVEGHIPMPLPGEVSDQGHAMCVVGYGYDTEFLGGGYLIIRNSWGTVWAPSSPFGPGYGTIPFSYIRHYGWEAFTLK